MNNVNEALMKLNYHLHKLKWYEQFIIRIITYISKLGTYAK